MQVKLASSALFFMNELDCVVGASLCPNQSWPTVKKVLDDIFATVVNCGTEVVWTDNVSNDSGKIKQYFARRERVVDVGQVGLITLCLQNGLSQQMVP